MYPSKLKHVFPNTETVESVINPHGDLKDLPLAQIGSMTIHEREVRPVIVDSPDAEVGTGFAYGCEEVVVTGFAG